MNLAELRRLAEAATPGPWRVFADSYGGDGNQSLFVGPADQDRKDFYVAGGIEHEPTADYIAACDPATILRLLDVVHAATDIDGLWTARDDGSPILWEPEAGEALRDLRTALAALDEP